MDTNNGPKVKWWSTDFGHTVRQRLYVNGNETPYFVDSAHTAGHKSQGDEHGLYGSGMHPKGIALLLASGRRVTPLKHRAEQMALEAA